MRPRLGFLGLGWIGRRRLEAVAEADVADIAVLADPLIGSIEELAGIAPDALRVETLDALLGEPLDGVVIATPSAQHAQQAEICLDRGLAVFCQKPLARTRDEVEALVAAARAADRLLSVDMCYRETAALCAIKRLVGAGALGSIYAADFVFHNAYGPGQDWYYARHVSGGGCVLDLGIHLLDQLHWLLGWRDLRVAHRQLLHRGRPWAIDDDTVEDFAHIVFEGPGGALARVTCSWRAPAGRDACLTLELFGTGGGARMSNVGGSFYDFVAERLDSRHATVIAAPPDDWGGRAVVRWAQAIADGGGYSSSCESQVTVAGWIDEIYRGSRFEGSNYRTLVTERPSTAY